MPVFLLLQSSLAWGQLPWCHTTSIYQIYPRSFYDTNGDGIGDIQGIIQKLDYIHQLGFESVWCSPFFTSPQQDFGYDISDYRSISPEYGTTQDAEQLISEAHKRGMKVIFDMVLNHTSIQHPWFEKDRNRNDKNSATDYYVWTDKPNNWKSMVSGSAWHFDSIRQQYYYAAFLPFQPDLNYRNPEVRKAMLEHVRFWLDKGVDGFRLDIFNSLYEDSLLRDNPSSSKIQERFQKPFYTANQPECLQFAEELRKLCDSYGNRMLLGEIIGDRSVSRKYCGDEKNNRLTLAFDFEMLRFRFKAGYFSQLIKNLETDFPNPFMPSYVFSNHDRRRSMSRLKGDVKKAKLLHLLQFTVRGVPCMYYGEETGMKDARLPYKTALDPIPHYVHISRGIMNMVNETLNRDELRTPMQWSAEKNAGFSAASNTWLPVNDDYKTVNVESTKCDSSSVLNFIERVLKIRNSYTAFTEGNLRLINNLPGNVLGFTRTYNNDEVVVYINFSNSKKKLKTLEIPPLGCAVFHNGQRIL